MCCVGVTGDTKENVFEILTNFTYCTLNFDLAVTPPGKIIIALVGPSLRVQIYKPLVKPSTSNLNYCAGIL